MPDARAASPRTSFDPAGSADDRSRHLAASAAATLWWTLWHLPICALNYYGVLAAKRLWFALALRRARVARVASATGRRLVQDYQRDRISVIEGYLSPAALERLEGLLREAGCREAVARRKRQASGDPNADFFHLSQEPLAPELRERIFADVFPADFVPAFELARGRALRCHSVTYHETDPADPLTSVGDSSYNAHPFHTDGNPKFAKALLYLSDVGESAGPFEMVPSSRFGVCDELLRLAYGSKRARRSAIASRLSRWLPACFRRPTHFWTLSAAEIEQRYGRIRRALGRRGSFVIFDGMNLHNGSRDQKERREVLHFIFV